MRKIKPRAPGASALPPDARREIEAGILTPIQTPFEGPVQGKPGAKEGEIGK